MSSPLRAAPRYAAFLRVAFLGAEGFLSDQVTNIVSYARFSLSKAGVGALVSRDAAFRARLDRSIDGTIPRSKPPAMRLLSIARSGLAGSSLQRNLDEQLRPPMRLGVDLQPSP